MMPATSRPPSVLVTADAAARRPLLRALRRFGVVVRAVPTVGLVPVERGTPEGEILDAALRLTPHAARLVVTSPRGARIVLGRLAELGIDPRRLRWAAVGRATARPLSAAGVEDLLLPPTADGASLAETIVATEALDGATVVLARASAAAGDVPARLARAGARVIEAVAYRTVEGPGRSRARLASALADPDLAAITFASGSAVRGLRSLADGGAFSRARQLPAVVIGQRTAAAARAEGFETIVVAAEPSAAALAQAVADIVARATPTDPHHTSRGGTDVPAIRLGASWSASSR